MLDRHRIVVVPPDNRFGRGVAHHEFVLGAASGMRARVSDKGAMRGDTRFVASQRVLVKLRRAEVPVNRGKIAEAEPVRAEGDVVRPVLDHASSVPRMARLNGLHANPQSESLPTLCGDDLARTRQSLLRGASAIMPMEPT